MTRARTLALAVLTLLLASCTGWMQYEQSRDLMMQGATEEGLVKLQEAMQKDPKNVRYKQLYEQMRSNLIKRWVAQGDLLRSAQNYDGAVTAYQLALKYDAENARAKAGLAAIDIARDQLQIVARAEADIKANKLDEAERNLRTLLTADPGQRRARELLNKVADVRAEAAQNPPQQKLKGPFTQPITLEFRDASLKSVFEVISRSTGINFVFDRDVRTDTKINIFVRNTSLDDVIKLILVTNQLDRKLLNENTLLIYPNTPAKQKDYRELVVRSFYLQNADVKQALNLVKGMVKTPDVFIDEKLNLMVVKDTPEAVRVIQGLVRAMDLAEPEVMLEVEVLEVAAARLQQLGIKYPEQIAFGKPTGQFGNNNNNNNNNGGGTGTGTGTGTVDSGVLPFVIGTDSLKAFTINPPLLLDILAQDSNANILANPQIRVKNREKAKVHIGSKVPVVTTTSTANVGVSSSVSYLDVGLKLDVEPNIYLRDDVSIKVGLEVSNIVRQVNINGTLAYELGTRTTGTVLQLKDGETAILAGLINNEDRKTSNKIPGLGDIPVVGRLFGTQGDDTRRTEIVMIITPRIVRTVNYPQVAALDNPVGTDAAIGNAPLKIAPTVPGAVGLASSGGGQPGAIPGPQGVPPGIPVPRAVMPPPPGEAGRGGQPAVPGQPPLPPGSEGQDAQANAGQPSTLLMAAPLSARPGSDIVVSLSLTPGGSAARATGELAYDPMQLEPVGVTPASPGRVPVRIDGSTAVRFRVLLAGGRTQVRVDNVVGLDAGGGALPVSTPGPVEISVGQ